MIVIGLTGSIGMGKSMAGSMLQYLGVPVHDADACVHELLQHNSPAWRAFTVAFPYFSHPQIYGRKWSFSAWVNGTSPWRRFIKRDALGKLVFQDDALRARLEGVLHPFVWASQQEFLRKQGRSGCDVAALDVPLLFETGADMYVDYIINISAPGFIQRARVLRRPGIDEDRMHALLKQQMSNGEKSARADFIVHSGLGRGYMMKALKSILSTLRAGDKTGQKKERGI